MTLPDWRKPCDECDGTGLLGVYAYVDEGTGEHLGGQTITCEACGGPGGSPITYADLEALGERRRWCEIHDAEMTLKDACWRKMDPYNMGLSISERMNLRDCVVGGGRLLIPLPEQEVVK